MNLNPVEWSQAQDLLIKLVQVLTPLTERIVPASFFLSRRFVIPSGLMQDDCPSVPLRHPVRILSALHTVQQEVEKWIGKAPQEIEERKGEVRPPVSRNPNVPKETPPLSKQAQKLIHEVQKAIGELANSTYIQDPKEAPLREALKKLKPNLDRIIDSMAHEKEPEQAPTAPFRQSIPRTPRDFIFAKSHTFAEVFPKEASARPATVSQPGAAPAKDPVDPPIARLVQKGVEKEGRGVEPASPKSIPMPSKAAPVPISKDEAVSPAPKKKGEVKEGRERPKENSIETKPLKVEAEVDKPGRKEGHSEVKVTPKPFEAITLPGAPFISQAKNLIAPRKKKKRKGFWFKGEEDLEERNNS